MRRSRTIREHRNKLLRQRAASNSERRKKTSERILAKKNKNRISKDISKDRLAAQRAEIQREKAGLQGIYSPAKQPLNFGGFISYDDYKFSYKRTINILHVIESVGLGGAQTMMLELVNALNNYYGKETSNKVVFLSMNVKPKISNRGLYKSYGLIPENIGYNELKDYCIKNEIDIVVQHRISISRCLKKNLPDKVKYILLNHTWNALNKVQDFIQCDIYVSVCEFLHSKTFWKDFIHPSRRTVILNGVENNYVAGLPDQCLEGSFITGRCHRLVPSKFAVDSIRWMDSKVTKHIPGFRHYLMGSNSDAKDTVVTCKTVKYLGAILDRNEKMSIIKGFDLYFYETFHPEGASVAILESLACGIPVICKPLGGNMELVKNGVNGYIVLERSDFLNHMKILSFEREVLNKLKLSTMEDFNNRLHVRHTASKYLQLIECLMDEA